MKPDHAATDALIAKYERRIKKEYKEAEQDLKKKLKEHTQKYKAKDKIKQAELKAGMITKAEYNDWKQGQIFTGKLWEQKRDLMARELQTVSEKAHSMRYGFQIEAYAESHAYGTYTIEKALGINTAYTLYSKEAVERLMKNEKILPDPTGLLKDKIDRGEVLKWRNGKIQSAVTQSILQGESIEKTTARIAEKLAVQDASAALRYARTSMTAAANSGKLDSMRRAVALGVKLGKQWFATPDGLTRESHREVDGEIVPVESTFSNGCMYPGDPGGPPEEVWNCRCDMESALDGMDNDIADLEERFHREEVDDYFEWKTAHLPDEKKAEAKAKYWTNLMTSVGDKTYTGIWRQAVTTKEYEAYKDRIQGKRDYYNAEMAKLDKADPKYKEFQGYLNNLDEFERNGKLYATYANELKLAEDELKAVKLANVDPTDMFSQVRKDNALWFREGHSEHMAAHKYYDVEARAAYNAASSQEQSGFYVYTAGSGGHNRPLAGYQKPFSNPYDSGWEEKYFVGPNKVWIDYEGKGDEIRGLTTLCEKVAYKDDVWLQSGQGFETLEGTLGLVRGSLENMTESELNKLIGTEMEVPQFISTSIHKGGGGVFNKKPTKWNIYVPSGSEMFYASDIGAYNMQEAEMILQRGGHYKITDIYWGNDNTDRGKRKLFIEMELHPEKGYNKFQQDPSEWKGSRKNNRS